MLDDRLVPLDTASATPVSEGLAWAVEAALAVDIRGRPQDTGQWLAFLGERDAGGKSPAVPERDAGVEA